MAEKTKRGNKGLRPQVWVPDPNDAIRLAALRWFALEMERISIEIYATDKRKFALTEKILRKALRSLSDVHEIVNVQSDDECPDGYILCKDGTCAPACDPSGGGDNES